MARADFGGLDCPRPTTSSAVTVIDPATHTKNNTQPTQSPIGAGSRVPGGAQAPPELFLAPPEPFEPPLTIEKIMH